MKKTKAILIIVAMLATFLFLSGFSATPSKGLIFKVDKEDYNIDDVTLDFYFGLNNPQNRRHDQARYKEQIILLFSNKEIGYDDNDFYEKPLDLTDQNLFFVREINPDEFYSDEYSFESSAGFGCSRKEDTYSHSEKITIPQDVFKNESGAIVFHIKIELWDISGETETFSGSGGERFSIKIYYKLNNDKVKISDSYIQ